ncbi:MAG: peptidase, partial [Thermoproteota archaeon]|nr:peptidase [Thermoproteota archaeon]
MQSGSQKVSRFAFAASLAVLSIVAATLSNQEAFGDGLTSETFSATLGDRNAELLVQVNPPILTDASRNDAYILFRLYDANNNQTIQYTTFFISVEKGVGQDAETIMPPTLFHTESGLLRLKVQPTEGELQIFGTQEQFLSAWVADPGGTVNIQGPLFLEGGLYHLRVEIFGVDNIRNIFADENIPKFDSWLSVGDVFTQTIDYQGHSYDTTIISYYDRVRNFSFDGNKQQFTWSMP